MAREDWEYAGQMFGTSVSLVPDNLLYRQTLRGVQYRRYNNNKKGAKMAGVKLVGIRGRIKKARMRSDWKAVDKAAEEGLTLNPWDAHLNFDLGEACENLGFYEVAKFAYEKAVEAEPKNKNFLRKLAGILEERAEYTPARQCWEQIYKLDPMDSEARSKITQLQASMMLDRQGLEDAQSTREMKTAYDDYAQPTTQQQAPVGPGESLEEDLQRAIRKNPADKDNYLRLADLYQRDNRTEEAAKVLKTALDASGGDPTIREQLEDVELDLMRQNLEAAKEAVRANSEDETAKKNAAALAREFLSREIEVLTSRVEKYPKDSRNKFELAQRHMRLKAWPKAIPLLQQASADKRIATDVLVSLGECFFNDKKKDLARRQFEKALESIDQHERPDLFKKAHYALGVIAEVAGKTENAENHYQEILAIDYEYRDTLDRLEKLQGSAEEEQETSDEDGED